MTTQTAPSARPTQRSQPTPRVLTSVEVGSLRAGWATIIEILEEGMERMEARAITETKVESTP